MQNSTIITADNKSSRHITSGFARAVGKFYVTGTHCPRKAADPLCDTRGQRQRKIRRNVHIDKVIINKKVIL